jgi:hypothetical protein
MAVRNLNQVTRLWLSVVLVYSVGKRENKSRKMGMSKFHVVVSVDILSV